MKTKAEIKKRIAKYIKKKERVDNERSRFDPQDIRDKNLAERRMYVYMIEELEWVIEN